jgi:hypothetical protein
MTFDLHAAPSLDRRRGQAEISAVKAAVAAGSLPSAFLRPGTLTFVRVVWAHAIRFTDGLECPTRPARVHPSTKQTSPWGDDPSVIRSRGPIAGQGPDARTGRGSCGPTFGCAPTSQRDGHVGIFMVFYGCEKGHKRGWKRSNEYGIAANSPSSSSRRAIHFRFTSNSGP